MATELGTAYVSIQPSARGLGASVFQDLGAGASSAGGQVDALSNKMALASAVGGLAAQALGAAFSAVASNIGAAVSRADTMNNFPKVMTSLGYSADEAAASVQKISASLDGLPTSSADMVSMVQQLAATTGDLQLSTDAALAFNNAMLAGGQGTQIASNAFTQYNQMLAAGKVDQQAWNSLVSAAPGQMNQLAQTLLGADANQRDLYSAMKAGTVTFDDFNAALVALNEQGGEGFASFEEQARSATGGIGTAMENVQNRIAKAIEKVIEWFGVDSIGAAINDFSSQFSGIADGVIAGLDAVKGAGILDTLSGISATVSGLVGSLASSVGPVLAQIGSALLPVIQGALTAVGAALSAVVAVVQPLASILGGALLGALQALQPAFDAIGGVLSAVGDALAAVASAVSDFVGTASPALTDVQAVASMASGGICDAFGGVVDVLGTVGGVVADVLGAAIPAAASALQPVIDAVGTAFSTVFAGIQSVVQTVGTVISGVFTAIGSAVTATWGAISAATSAVWSAISQVIQTSLVAIQAMFAPTLAPIQAVVSGIFGLVQSAMTDPIETARDLIDGAISTIQGVIDGLDLSLPSIALPHFNVSAGEFPWGIGGEGSMPSFSVDWYAKGGIVPRAAVLGEAGAEAIVPYTNSNIKPWAAALADAIGVGADEGGATSGSRPVEVALYVDGKRLASTIARPMNQQLGILAARGA